MSNSIDTLLYQIRGGSFFNDGSRVAFLNAQFHSGLADLGDCELTLQQYFKPYADELLAAGFSSVTDIPSDDGAYDLALLLLPKNMVEARYLMARALLLLRDGGALICAADNKAGGTRLKKLMQNFGLSDLCGDARNKARAVSGTASDLNKDEIAKAIKAGAEQQVLDGKFTSQAGVFGWDKIDKGSEILTRYLPKNLKGRGADFGCGYGYLSDYVLSNYPKVKHMTCVDADYRAVDLCRKNLSKYDCMQEFLWGDLTKVQPHLGNLDFIIMNPPFHEGKKVDKSIAKKFIENAHKSLRRGGRLYMVANNHLAYEEILYDIFSECDHLYEGQGFKIFCSLQLPPPHL